MIFKMIFNEKEFENRKLLFHWSIDLIVQTGGDPSLGF